MISLPVWVLKWKEKAQQVWKRFQSDSIDQYRLVDKVQNFSRGQNQRPRSNKHQWMRQATRWIPKFERVAPWCSSVFFGQKKGVKVCVTIIGFGARALWQAHWWQVRQGGLVQLVPWHRFGQMGQYFYRLKKCCKQSAQGYIVVGQSKGTYKHQESSLFFPF